MTRQHLFMELNRVSLLYFARTPASLVPFHNGPLLTPLNSADMQATLGFFFLRLDSSTTFRVSSCSENDKKEKNAGESGGKKTKEKKRKNIQFSSSFFCCCC